MQEVLVKNFSELQPIIENIIKPLLYEGFRGIASLILSVVVIGVLLWFIFWFVDLWV